MINVVIDVSHHNGPNIDFAKVKAAGIVGVIHKATAVSNFKDKMYPVNRARALAAGLLWGAYHWGVGDAEAEDQVNYFLDYAQPTAQSLLALDSEPNLASAHRLGPDMSPEQATEFVTSINGRFDRFPLLYTGHAMEGRIPELPQCPLWWARYANAPIGIPPAWPNCTLWQYTDGHFGPEPHAVDGIGNCDRDQFNGDLSGLQRLWGAA